MVGRGVWKTRGQQNKRGTPLFFFAPPLRGGVRKKRGVRKERGVHAPRAPPLSTLMFVTWYIQVCSNFHDEIIIHFSLRLRFGGYAKN